VLFPDSQEQFDETKKVEKEADEGIDWSEICSQVCWLLQGVSQCWIFKLANAGFVCILANIILKNRNWFKYGFNTLPRKT